MTHEAESTFEDDVERYLYDEFGESAEWIDDNVWLPGTSGYADFWVEFSDMAYAIEVENDADSIRPGCAQAMEYASPKNHYNAVPVVIVPEGHNEAAVTETFRGYGVIIIEVEG